MKKVMFSKLLQHMEIEELAATVAALGFYGVDLTVRPGGYIAPEEVEKRLPRAVKQCAEHGLAVPMITTAITSADDAHAQATVATAAAHGVEAIKCGYWRYRQFGRLRDELAAMSRDLDGLEVLARRFGVPLTIHIHSGDYLTAEVELHRAHALVAEVVSKLP